MTATSGKDVLGITKGNKENSYIVHFSDSAMVSRAVAKQQSEAWRKALDGVPDSLRILLDINNTEKVPEYSPKQKKQYNDAIKAYEHTGNGVSWSQFEWKTYDTQMTVTFEDSAKVESISKGMNVING